MKWIFFIAAMCLLSCGDKSANTAVDSPDGAATAVLTRARAASLLELPLHCLTQEYPNKLGQVLGSAADLKTPRELRPLFYGCFDWHSSVHGYWSIIKLLTRYPDLDADGAVRKLLEQHFTPEHVQVEIAFFNEANNSSFERTYGWAWLLALQAELSLSQDVQFRQWGQTLLPLSDLIVERYQRYLPKLVYPIRTGQHDNSAFSMILALDYARAMGDSAFEKLLVSESKRLFATDVDCNLSYEPSGYDFLSPCFEEALLFSKILDQAEYRIWLKQFLPAVFKKDFQLLPAVVSDRTDGKLVHLDGLNFSRSHCLSGIFKALPELSHLQVLANQHFNYSIDHLNNDDYMGSHWLGTFAIYAILND
ncbi:DUF2891 domain-containing protein [Flavobacterium sp. JP2137]|uniref:DUF2891 domain-containing protein n=1 Tax=Flavobacterium sp. JP2137 TaxID=3414510 RepID=UPI003D2FAB04